MSNQARQTGVIALLSAVAVNVWIFPMLWRVIRNQESAAWFFGQSRSWLLRGIGDLLVRS